MADSGWFSTSGNGTLAHYSVTGGHGALCNKSFTKRALDDLDDLANFPEFVRPCRRCQAKLPKEDKPVTEIKPGDVVVNRFTGATATVTRVTDGYVSVIYDQTGARLGGAAGAFVIAKPAPEHCSTIGCKRPVTTAITYSYRGEDEATTDLVCGPCADSYSRRVVLKNFRRTELTPAPWMNGRGNKRDRQRFAALTSDQRQAASGLAASKYDGSRTVARCWAEALDETEATVEDQAVDWLLRLRQLQAEGKSFDEALAQANAEV